MLRLVLICTFLAAVLGVAVSGCYDSPVPLASSDNSTIDDGICRDWIGAPASDGRDGTTYLMIRKFNDKEYFIAYQDEGDRAAECFRGYSLEVQGKSIMHVQSIDNDKRPFLFFAFWMTDQGTLKTQIVNADFPLFKGQAFETPEEQLQFFENHMHMDDFFAESGTFSPLGGDIAMRLSHGE